ncbi:helix-turn-helix domain-containing protein [Breznakia pachnodae]|uniref:AraC-like DNA-binding protein n=1 Tax=Breznakia pachnodae TaxID=265178 RepID=A0ABU0E0F7_9FIRM|nr:AraC family transcriptional regulator [Breznakia pachnodae]MDQ0360300.1 AraC-like DNA-binding protein [Breznakia pachnodae]
MKNNSIFETSVSSFIFDYKHHTYEEEKNNLSNLLKSESSLGILSVDLNTYMEVLGPDPIRAMKNSLITFITLLCRSAIDLGVPAEKSFSLSDYYINELESCDTPKALQVLSDDLLNTYKGLVKETDIYNYCYHVEKAVRYINANIYNNLQVQDVCSYLKINQRYFSRIFKKDTQISPSTYIINKKIEEAKKLLKIPSYSIKDVSEILNFCNYNHFSYTFKKVVGITPKEFQHLR